MKKLFSIALLLDLLCASVVWPQDADPNQISRMSLNQLSSNLLKILEESKNKITNLQQSLTTSLQELNQLKTESATLKTESNQLKQTQEEQNRILMQQSNSLLSINKELINSFQTIENYKTKLKIATEWVTGLAIVCILFLILKIVAIVLRIKFQIKLPWIIDIIV